MTRKASTLTISTTAAHTARRYRSSVQNASSSSPVSVAAPVWSVLAASIGVEGAALGGDCAEVGDELGVEVGAAVGAEVGAKVGASLGARVGAEVATPVHISTFQTHVPLV